MSMNVLAIAGNFFQFIEVREKFQVVYGRFWIELFLAYHRTFGIFLITAGIWEQVLVGSISSMSRSVCVCIPILVTTFPQWLSGTEPLPHTPGAVRPSSLCL